MACLSCVPPVGGVLRGLVPKIAGFVPETVVFLGVSPPIGGKGFRMAGVNMGVFEGETHVLVCLSIDE